MRLRACTFTLRPSLRRTSDGRRPSITTCERACDHRPPASSRSTAKTWRQLDGLPCSTSGCLNCRSAPSGKTPAYLSCLGRQPEFAAIGNAAESLQRAQSYFSRKGDRRMQALAYLKLSTVYNNLGDLAGSAEATRLGLNLVPEDDHATRLRLRGNLSVTTTWLKSASDAERECMRVAVESIARGYEQYAAIAYHNLGVMLRHSGRLVESLANLERAARFWDASPRNPFADNSELVHTLLMLGHHERAHAVASSAMTRTSPWPRPHAEARYGMALVLAQRGLLAAAISALRSLKQEGPEFLAPLAPKATALLVECLYLNDSPAAEFRLLLEDLERPGTDPRVLPLTSVAAAIAGHRLGNCDGRCRRAEAVMDRCEAQGARLTALLGRLKLLVLAPDHGASRPQKRLRETLIALHRLGLTAHVRWWTRRLRGVTAMAKWPDASSVMGGLIADDPEHWISKLLPILGILPDEGRASLLGMIEKIATPQTPATLRGSSEPHVVEVRRKLARRFAERLFLRSLGPLVIHRGSWRGPVITIGRKRIRALLGLLAAHYDGGLTREAVLERLWPDSDPQSAVNSLNQAVYQLRRLIDPTYREGESPPYIISNVDIVQLDPALVTTDLAEIRSLARLMNEPQRDDRRDAILRLLDLIRGEYLDDLRYEEWVLRCSSQLMPSCET